MNNNELQEMKKQVYQTAQLLYQNKKEGLSALVALLPLIQQMGNICVSIDYEKQVQEIEILKKLLEGYQSLDVLQMADVLNYEVVALIDVCLSGGV